MITKKLEEMVRRQSALTAKLLDKTATDEEKAELGKLNDAIAAATAEEPAKVDGKTTLKTVKLADFQQEADALMAGEPTAGQLALLKRNLAAVKDQAVTDPEGLVAIEVLVELSAEDQLSAMDQRVKDLEARLAEGFDGRTRTGLANPTGDKDEDGDGDSDGNPTASKQGDGDKNISQQLASEAIDSLITRFAALKKKIEAGTLKLEDVQDAWNGDWELRKLIEGAAAVLAKLDEAKALIEAVTPKLEELAKKIEGDSADDSDNASDGDDDDADDGKGAEKSAWPTGDMAGPSKGSQEQFSDLRKNRVN